MTVDEIRELINLASETGIAELEVQRGDSRVRIRRAGFAAQDVVVGSVSHDVSGSPAPSPFPGPYTSEPPRERGEKPHDPNLFLVKSPIGGTFY